ncbi:MAG: O-antigen ligase family protein [Afipia sp.]
MTTGINEFERSFPPRFPAGRGGAIGLRPRRDASRAHPLATWLALSGVVLPTELQLTLAGARLTLGRMGIMLLIVPALVALFQKGRKLLVSDFIALVLAAWMVWAGFYAGSSDSISSAIALGIEYSGGYLVARAFFFGPAALRQFVRVLKILTAVVVALGMVDFISGRWVVHDALVSIVGAPWLGALYRGTTVRAASTLDHPILFGTYCSLAAAIFLFSESRTPKRIFWVGISFVGCAMSQSSAGMMSFFLALSIFLYESAMKSFPARWGLFWCVVGVTAAVIFAATNHPIGWIISHMTFDPTSGFYRILIWDAAFEKIAQAPVTGFAFDLLNNDILDHTVDCVWLVSALRFGLPAITLMVLFNLLAMLPAPRQSVRRGGDDYMDRMRRAFTVVLLLYMFVGLTVHFWNFMWIFWGVCVGCRASLREWFLVADRT